MVLPKAAISPEITPAASDSGQNTMTGLLGVTCLSNSGDRFGIYEFA
jgi:hypothetical protein